MNSETDYVTNCLFIVSDVHSHPSSSSYVVVNSQRGDSIAKRGYHSDTHGYGNNNVDYDYDYINLLQLSVVNRTTKCLTQGGYCVSPSGCPVSVHDHVQSGPIGFCDSQQVCCIEYEVSIVKKLVWVRKNEKGYNKKKKWNRSWPPQW